VDDSPVLTAKHRALFDAMPVAVTITTGPAGEVVYANPAFVHMIGAPEGTAVEGGSALDHLCDEDAEKAARNIAAIVAGHEPIDDTAYRIWDYTRTRTIEVDIYAVAALFDGRPALFSVFTQGGGRTRDELRRAEADLNEAQDIARIGSYVFDIVGDAWTSSHTLDEIFGIDASYERTARGWLGLVHPDDAAAMTAYLEQHVLAKQLPFDMVYRIVRPGDGETRWVHGRGRLRLDEDRRPVALIGTIQDITERKHAEDELRESEERLTALFQKAPLGYQSLDADGRFIDVNEAWLETLGYERDDVIGAWFGDFLAPEYVEAFRERFPLFKSLGAIHSEFEMVHKDGTRRTVAFEGRIGHNADGSFRQTHCILSDISERKRAEDELARYREGLETLVADRTAALEEASRAKSAFLASMSHELRTPLNSIIGFTGVMLQGLTGELTAEQRAQLEMVNRSGRQLLGLISDVLDLAKIESGRVAVEREPVELPRFVGVVAETVRPMAQDVGLELNVNVSAAPHRIVTDRRRLEQILLNLLSNAVKYTDEGRVTLTVTGDDANVSFEVADTGAGIAPEDHERIFEEFRQLPATRGAKHPGSGLGLAISRQLAEVLGGRIELESEVGVGSTFTLILPTGPPRRGDGME